MIRLKFRLIERSALMERIEQVTILTDLVDDFTDFARLT